MVTKNAIFIAILVSMCIPSAYALDVVSTTSVLWDPIQYIGGEHVEVIYVADPTICPHMQSDIIPSRIQLGREFISTADIFVAHNGSVDADYVMPYVDDFMRANGYGEVAWVTLANSSMTWNTPDAAKALATEVAGWLIGADPANEAAYRSGLDAYLAEIDAADLTEEERQRIAGQDAIVMVWQQEPAETWLGLNVVSIYGPEFYMGGKYTPAKVVDEIAANPDAYRNVAYVIENMQSGEMAKGLHEYLTRTVGAGTERVIFTNFPKSLPGVDSIPDVLRYNKNLVMPAEQVAAEQTPSTTATEAPLGTLTVVSALAGAAL
ncbi:MAG TPA: zinc ABC transporter substrate-binding protein, partial [Methanoculleus sp.]|nr:zinc ABC transporter substrate-binding protein [Methanoculleus sp.]